MNRKELYNGLSSTDMELSKISALSFFYWTKLNVQPDPLFEEQYMTIKKRNLSMEQLWELYLEDDS